MRIFSHIHVYLFVFFILLLFFLSAGVAHGQIQLLSNLPGLDPTKTVGSGNLAEYLNTLYLILIGVGSLFAVIKIALAGVKYSMSDVITDKSDAKKDIMGALIGLAIILLPFVILNTIYGGLTNLNILSGMTKIEVPPPAEPTPPAQTPTQALQSFKEWCEGKGGRPTPQAGRPATCEGIPNTAGTVPEPIEIAEGRRSNSSAVLQEYNRICTGPNTSRPIGTVRSVTYGNTRILSCEPFDFE